MFTDLDDYAPTVGHRGWTSRWHSRAASSDVATAVADRSGIRVAVRTALATLICTLIDWTEREDGGNYPLLNAGECDGCDRHPIAITSTAFNHSWAVDVDINGSDDPLTTADPPDLPPHVARVWNRYGFAWGGDHGHRRDWMHFEFMGTPSDAIELAHAALRDLAPDGRDECCSGEPTG
jgi:hypothetical protein